MPPLQQYNFYSNLLKAPYFRCVLASLQEAFIRWSVRWLVSKSVGNAFFSLDEITMLTEA